MSLASRFGLAIAALAWVSACQSPIVKYGTLNPVRADYRPLLKWQACVSDDDCAPVDVDCVRACPGGGGINRKYLAAFRSARAQACASVKRSSTFSERVCVAAPVHCQANVCAWAYEGPDPGSL